ncbi:MAG: serine hydrolase [Cyanobacteria bacterium P01_C01_bin.120]
MTRSRHRSSKRSFLSRRVFWSALPLVGFVSGLVLASGVNFVRQRTELIGLTRATVACGLSTNFKADGTRIFPRGCDVAKPIEPLRSPWAETNQAIAQGLDFLTLAPDYNQLRYSVTTPPPFQTTTETKTAPGLQEIVDGVVQQVADKGLPPAALSVSLVDLTGDCCGYGAYQDQQPRYPASVVKLFWLVALYGQYEAGTLQPDVDVRVDDEALMAHYSNNGASSRIVDALTQTESGEELTGGSWQHWLAARQSLNTYFLRANYPNLNIAHKTFPIPDLGLTERHGRDRQLANDENTLGAEPALARNYLTTQAMARLLYEIDTGQAISANWSDRIKQHLRHSTDPAVWQREDPNAIAGFFGEYLPPDVQLFTKLGFTFDDGRQEAAIIASPDNQTRFALVMFANDAVYSYEDVTVFPTVARYVYDQMQYRSAERSP